MDGSLAFTKMTAAGNDFICVDGSTPEAARLLQHPRLSEIVQRLCRHGLGVGADGLIFALPPSGQPFAAVAARFFDPDGTEVELCGNGTACFTEWVLETELVKTADVIIQTPAGLAQGKRVADTDGRIRVCIPKPFDLRLLNRVEVDNRCWIVHTVTTGVPHGVVFVDGDDRLEDLEVSHWGPRLRRHPAFGPRGINVNFVKVLEVGHIAVRTFEFGVEDETLACGTGCSSSAFITALIHNWPDRICAGDDPVLVDVRGGETLKVWFVLDRAKRDVASVCLETRVRAVFEGRIKNGFLAF